MNLPPMPEYFYVDSSKGEFDVHEVLRRGIQTVLHTRAQPAEDGHIVTLFPAIAMVAVMAVADDAESERRTAATGMTYIGTKEVAFRLHLASKMRKMADDIEAAVQREIDADKAEHERAKVQH